jgi:hypothetical protein
MSKLIDLTGQRFGRLYVIERAGSSNGNALWLCLCDCGKMKVVNGVQLRCGETKSCGCIQREIISNKMSKHKGTINDRRLYRVWAGMISRTSNPNATNYQYYGGRGIQVCEQWKDFSEFRKWAFDNGYDINADYGKCTLDRIDTNDNYYPENCRWVSMETQNNNQRSNMIITYNGETHNYKQWADILKINYSTFRKYMKIGKTIDDILSTRKEQNSTKKIQSDFYRKSADCQEVKPIT